jgi:hypothetical protein
MPAPTNCEHQRRGWLHISEREFCHDCGVVLPTASHANQQAPRDTPERSGESAEQALEAMR